MATHFSNIVYTDHNKHRYVTALDIIMHQVWLCDCRAQHLQQRQSLQGDAGAVDVHIMRQNSENRGALGNLGHARDSKRSTKHSQ